ncbi:FecR family protein [Pollutibacter soli]|uniref:FecR family protein n=1 Tax=Pollutibacter soli TaxID=3034157 RepID=UPI0030138C2A
MSENRIWQLASKKLAGEASPAEIKELESLLRQNPDLHYALQNLNDLWHLPAKKTGLEAEAFARHLERMEKAGISFSNTEDVGDGFEYRRPVSKSNRVFWISFALAFVLIVSTVIFLQFNQKEAPAGTPLTSNPLAEKNEVSTKNGSRSIVTLPDGTHVTLNSGSTLGYSKDFGNSNRDVELIGEGFFDVVHNENLPFIIHTKQVEIRVLGTMFNVKSYPEERETETSLVRGKVEVRPNNEPEKKYFLLPNEKITVRENKETADTFQWKGNATNSIQADLPMIAFDHLKSSSRDSSVKMETAWVDNKLAFENESFEMLTQRMERWYGVNIEFKERELGHIRIRGIFETETLEQALEALSVMAGGFRYSIKNNTVKITK